jgi:hypothetical protein
MDEIINSIGPYILQIAGALMLAAIGAYLAGLNNRRNRYHIISDSFHHSFLETISMFSNQDIDSGLYEHLEISFHLHKKAVLAFRTHLGFFRCIGFDRAWNNYRYGIKKTNPKPEQELPIPPLVQYYEGLNWKETIGDTKKLVLERIHKLLEFADPK